MNFTTSCTGNCNQGRACTCMEQREGFGVVRDGLPEMACYEPEPEPSLWKRLWSWIMSPDFGGLSSEEIKEYVRIEHECKQHAKSQKR